MKKAFLIVFCLVMASQSGFSQVGLWTKFSLEKELFKKLDFEVTGQYRVNEFGSNEERWIGEAGLIYDLPKGFELEAFYRYVSNIKTNSTKVYHRFHTDLKYGKKINSFIKVENRLRYQHQYKDDQEDGLVDDSSYLRNKIGLEFDTQSRFKPAIAADLFYELGGGLDQVRYSAELGYKLNKRNKIEVGFLIDDALKSTQKNQYRIALSYSIKL